MSEDGPVERRLETIVSIETPPNGTEPRALGQLLAKAATDQSDVDWAISVERAERLHRNPQSGKDIYRIEFVAILGSQLDSTAPINLANYQTHKFDKP